MGDARIMNFETKKEAESWRKRQPFSHRHKVKRCKVTDLVTFMDRYRWCVVYT